MFLFFVFFLCGVFFLNFFLFSFFKSTESGKTKANQDLDTRLFGRQVHVGDRRHDGDEAVRGSAVYGFADLRNALLDTARREPSLRVVVPALFDGHTELRQALRATTGRKHLQQQRLLWGLSLQRTGRSA